ncbi:Tyrosine recombinase XerC [subsurface metagenome]
MKTQAAIQAFLHNRRAKNLRPKTIEWYDSFLGRFASCYPEFPMKPEPIEDFLAQVTGEPETKHAYYRCLKALYRFICKRYRREGEQVQNPMEFIDPPRCPRKIMPTLEPREMMQLINLAEKAENLRDRALLSIFIDSGARVGEIATLRRQNIKENTIKVSGKTGEREIPISDESRRLLLALIATNGAGEYVFTNQQRGKPLTRYGIYWIVRAYMRKAGIQGPKQGTHRIRHGFGKGYLVNGGDLRSLQEIMGHAHISTTQKYASLNLNDVIAKHHKFTPLRSAHAAAQESLFDTSEVVKEAEGILERSSE